MKKLKIKSIVSIVLMNLFISATQAQENRVLGDFNGIKVGDAFNVIISQSEANTVKIDADEKSLSQIITEVKNGILIISAEATIKTDKAITITIGVKSLTSLAVSGSADVKSENQLIFDTLMVDFTGAGDVHLTIKANKIRAQLSGAGDLSLSGSTQLLDATVSGAGDLNATDLESNKVIAKVSGAGNAKVNTIQSLKADVSGSGSVIYKGSPIDRDVTISGAGSVRESKNGTGEETARDTTQFKLGKKKYMIIGDDTTPKYSKRDSLKSFRNDFKYWNGFEIGVNGLMDYKNSLNPPDNGQFLELSYAKSIQFGLNLFQKNFHLYKNYINIITGIGFDFNHYAFKNNVTLNPDTSYLSASTGMVGFKKNVLNVTYLKVPLLLEINTNKSSKNNFHIAGGVEFAYRIHSVTKQKYDIGDKHYTNKERDDYNLNPFLYSGVVRIGYNNITVFADYGLNRLFENNKGPQSYPFTLGITFSM